MSLRQRAGEVFKYLSAWNLPTLLYFDHCTNIFVKFLNVFVQISKCICVVFKYLSAWHLATWVDNITGTSLRDTCTSPPLSPHHCSNIQLVTKVSPSQRRLLNHFLDTLSLMSSAQTRRFVWQKRCQATDPNLEFLHQS